MIVRLSLVALLALFTLNAQTETGSLDFRATTPEEAPVAGASLTIEGLDGQTYSGVTERDGHVRIANLSPGVYRFTAFYAPGYTRSLRNFLADVSIHAGRTREFRFELVRAPRLQGVVLDEQGKPVVGAVVLARRPSTEAVVGSASTDAQGFYTMTFNSSPESFLSTSALPTLNVAAPAVQEASAVALPRRNVQDPLTIEFEAPAGVATPVQTLHLRLRMETASIR